MTKLVTVDCPDCGAPATFAWTTGIDEEDALMLISIDAKACRRCGAWLIPLEECCR